MTNDANDAIKEAESFVRPFTDYAKEACKTTEGCLLGVAISTCCMTYNISNAHCADVLELLVRYFRTPLPTKGDE